MFGSETQRNADVVYKAVISVLNRRAAGSMRANEWAAIRNGFAPKSLVLRLSHLEVKLFDAALDHLRALDRLEAAMVKVNNGSKPMAVIKLA
jgi:predicted amidohydrolase